MTLLPPPDDYPPRPSSRERGLVTTLSIIGVILGAKGLCAPVAVALSLSRGADQPNPIIDALRADAPAMAWFVVSYLVNFSLSVLLLGSSLGSIALRPWARRGMVVYGAVAAVAAIIELVVNTAWLEARMAGAQAQLPPELQPTQTARTVGFVLVGLGVVYAVSVFMVFRREKVVRAFEVQGDPPPAP